MEPTAATTATTATTASKAAAAAVRAGIGAGWPAVCLQRPPGLWRVWHTGSCCCQLPGDILLGVRQVRACSEQVGACAHTYVGQAGKAVHRTGADPDAQPCAHLTQAGGRRHPDIPATAAVTLLLACTGVTWRVPCVASTMQQDPAALCPAAPPAGCGAMKPGSALTAAAPPAGTTATQQPPARPVSTASSTGTHPRTAQPCCPTSSGSSGQGSLMRPQQRSSTRAGQTRPHLLMHDSWLRERLLLAAAFGRALAAALLPLLRHRRLLGRTAGRWDQPSPSRHNPGQANLIPRP